MAVLITGASGFIGTVLTNQLLEKGHRVYALSRHPPAPAPRLIPIVGDITEPNLGMIEMQSLKDITIIYHLAGIHTLRQEDKDGSIVRTNIEGTKNVLEFCLKHDIPRLYFASTAYTWPVNPYGWSKIENEADILKFAEKHGLKVTIFKPSIVLGTPDNPYPGHFSRFVSAIIQVHRRADLLRRKIEGTLRLPVIEPFFRIRANPEGKINLVQIAQVVWGMTDVQEPGIFWLTNPNPPTIQQVFDWIGEVTMLRIVAEPKNFRAQPIEAIFRKMATPFEPYLQGDNFPSDLQLSPPITKELIHDTIKTALLD